MDHEALRARRDQRRRGVRRRRAPFVGLVAVFALAAMSGGATHKPPSPAPAQAHAGGSTATSSASAKATSSTGRPGTEPVPILMYHVIAAPPAGGPLPPPLLRPAPP